MYFTVLNESRTLLARRKINGQERTDTQSGTSALPKLSNTENLIAGGASRAAIGFVMMPATVIKVRYEVRRNSNCASCAAEPRSENDRRFSEVLPELPIE